MNMKYLNGHKLGTDSRGRLGYKKLARKLGLSDEQTYSGVPETNLAAHWEARESNFCADSHKRFSIL